VNSHFHLCRRGYHHNRVDIVHLAVGTADVNNDLVALYLGTMTEAHRDGYMSWTRG
jgi:hypothetical protein